MELFNRKWRLTVNTIDTEGLNISFKVHKTLDHKPNTCDITVYNLSGANRQGLEQLNVYKKQGPGKIPVELYVGYAAGTHLIFRGDLRTSISTWDGSTWETHLTGDDGGQSVRWARINSSYPPNTPLRTVIQDLAAAMGVGVGNALEAAAQASFRGGGNVFARGTALSGAAPDILRRVLRSADLTYSVQDGVLQILRRGEGLQRSAVRLAPGTGAVDFPSRGADGNVTVRTLMIPELHAGRMVLLEYPHIRGLFRIKEITYSGDVAGKDWYSTLVLRDQP